jgi:predicted dehydrogenase
MIRAAIVGLGRWGRNLVEASPDDGRFKIVRAVEPDIRAAQGFCKEHGLDLTDNLNAVLADPAIDAVLLATPHSLHPGQVIACAAARKQVFADAIRMFEACREAGVNLAVGHSRRFWPSMRALRDIVAGGQLGIILHIEGHNSNENSNNVLAGWRLAPEESRGGGLTGAGLHILDAFVSMFGPAHRVYAQLKQLKEGPPPLDTAILALDFVNGVTGTLATVRATPFYWRIHVFGTMGSAEVLDEITLVLRTSGNKPVRMNYPAVDVLRAELNAFVDAIEGKASFPVPELEVLATLSSFEAGLQSMASGVPAVCSLSRAPST